MRGRPNTPTSLKILKGVRPCRLNKNEPKSPMGLGKPPEWLDDLGRAAWARLDEKLGVNGMNIATAADTEAAAIYCQNYSVWRKATVAVAVEGMTIETDTTIKLNPLFTAIHEAQRNMVRIIACFGLTPAARAGLHVQESPEADPLLSYLAGTGTTGASSSNGKPKKR
jgi:P27 family predicted phage terminase small subunit